MVVERAALREVPPPPNAPRQRDGDGARIRYFQAPDGRVAGFVGQEGRWTQVVAPCAASAFTEEASSAPPLRRVAPGVDAPMAEVEAPPGSPRATPDGEEIHWFASPGGSRVGLLREGGRWRPALRDASAAEPVLPSVAPAVALPPAAPAAGLARDASTPSWMHVPDLPRCEPQPSRTRPDAPRRPGAGSLRARARSWWEEAGRNTERRRPTRSSEPDRHGREISGAVHDLRGRRRWAGRLLMAVAVLGTALVVLTLVGDLVNAVHPPPQKVERVIEKGGNGGLSSADLAASSFAVQFAWAYLTYDQNNPQQHAAALAPYLGANVGDTWDGTGTQQVATAQATAVKPASRGTLDVTVAAYVASVTSKGTQQLRWLYLSVPVGMQGTRLVVAGAPTTIPPPPTGTPAPGALSPTVSGQDTRLTQQLTGAMRSFFQAWSSGSGTQLSYLETPNAGIQPLGSSQQTFVRLANFQVAQGAGERRISLALVTWSDVTTGARFTQPYTVTWRYSGNRWLISSVRPGTP